MRTDLPNPLRDRISRLAPSWGGFIGLILLLSCSALDAQNQLAADTSGPLVQTVSIVDSVKLDSLDRHTEISPLDIGRDRGIFILSSDKLMQMRILGSVRALFTLSDHLYEDKNALNQLEVPVGDVRRITNFYSGLEQTRLGFEVTRRTAQFGDIFLRIEADFQGESGGFRIRHAYGQMRNFVVGKTWSLFSNVPYAPAIVDSDGPSGSIGIRTPQIRYFRTLSPQMSWYLGLEYSTATIAFPDSIDAELVQVVPDLTGRLDYIIDNLSIQLAFLGCTLSGRDKSSDDNPVEFRLGYGVSVSARYDLGKRGIFYFSGTSGRGIAHYINLFANRGFVARFDQNATRYRTLPVHTGYVGYSNQLPAKFSFNAALGFAAMTNYDFQPADDYDYGYNFLINVFWQPTEGARLGIEFNHARHATIGSGKGRGNRISFLIYYDF